MLSQLDPSDFERFQESVLEMYFNESADNQMNLAAANQPSEANLLPADPERMMSHQIS